ncbi:MAG: phosphoribosylaminoimidazolesuccinocarboxamide synthase [Thermaerobacter sp.]|nr:phosphoribosylaminoimidazolesuccinocarboxamide synthase [Thermaerobacter sp.]
MQMDRIYEGKAKIVYRTDDPERVLMHFKDAATAFNGKKRGEIAGKGRMNAGITVALFRHLERAGVATHLLEQPAPDELLVRRLTMLPLEVVVRNLAAGSMSHRLGLEEGRPLSPPVREFYLKNDQLGDPWVNRHHILALGLADAAQVAGMEELAGRINELLRRFFAERELELVDFKLEFGEAEGRLILGDEITPDTCRLWQVGSHERMDKDRFRRDLGGVDDAYREVFRRVTGKEADHVAG